MEVRSGKSGTSSGPYVGMIDHRGGKYEQLLVQKL